MYNAWQINDSLYFYNVFSCKNAFYFKVKGYYEL